MLTGVTITGADDRVNPLTLVALSEEFPFVEWGILLSDRRAGTSRYPSAPWVERLVNMADGQMALSAHLCGGRARRLEIPRLGFRRVQINGYGGNREPSLRTVAHALLGRNVEFVLPVRDEAIIQSTAHGIHESLGAERASILYDPSGGRGIEPFRWPTAPLGVRMGYAGGIRPDSVEGVISDIGPVANPYWLDVETGVRRDDTFDLAMCREFLMMATHACGRRQIEAPP